MSFSSELKKELCALEQKSCCQRAETYALFLYGHRFDGNGMVLQTESGTVAQTAAALLAAEAGVFVDVRTPLTQRGHSRICTVTVEEPSQRAEVLHYFGHDTTDVGRHANFANLENECCAHAFLRGAFLACGTVSDPARGYHLEYTVPNRRLAEALILLLTQTADGLHPGLTERKSALVIYFKSSEEIIALLELLGAAQSAAHLRNVRRIKEYRNDANRRTNFDTANIDKTVSAAAEQVEAIRRVQASPEWTQLPDTVRELAELRLAHPEYSLRELGDALSVPMSRSGVNHRLERLRALADAI